MSPAAAVATAVTFGWLGMVLAISFLEAPLKFRAPGVTLRIGLGIGRLVFRALNSVEAVLAGALAVALVAGPAPAVARPGAAVAIVLLAGQVLVLRPRLSRRTDRVLAGEQGTRSRAHAGYVLVEAGKVVALLVTGVLLVAS